jgi:hypothetical protein
MQTRYFEIDFFKFVLVFSMVFRHTPLYIYNKSIVEYSISNLDIYTLFIPVTSGFVFILGYTLGFSYIQKIKNNIKCEHGFRYFKMFLFFLTLSMFFSVITFFRNVIELSFIDYFFTYIWNTAGKPGFYILFPISLIYLVNHLQYILKIKYFIEIVSTLTLITLNFYDLYALHYFLFALIGYIFGLKINFKTLIEKINIFFLMLSLILYMGIYFINYTDDINFFIELYLLLLLFIISIGLSKYMVLHRYKRIKYLIIFSSKNILPFYILHVIGLQLISKYINLESLYIVGLMSIFYYLIIIYLIYFIRKVFYI